MNIVQESFSLRQGGYTLARQPIVTEENVAKAAKNMEKSFLSLFLNKMLPDESSLWGDSHTGAMVKSFWVEAVSNSFPNTGLYKTFYKSLEKHMNQKKETSHDITT